MTFDPRILDHQPSNALPLTIYHGCHSVHVHAAYCSIVSQCNTQTSLISRPILVFQCYRCALKKIRESGDKANPSINCQFNILEVHATWWWVTKTQPSTVNCSVHTVQSQWSVEHFGINGQALTVRQSWINGWAAEGRWSIVQQSMVENRSRVNGEAFKNSAIKCQWKSSGRVFKDWWSKIEIRWPMVNDRWSIVERLRVDGQMIDGRAVNVQ